MSAVFLKNAAPVFTDRHLIAVWLIQKGWEFIFLPFWKIINRFAKAKDSDIGTFLSVIPRFTMTKENTGESYLNEAQSFLYKTIVKSKQLGSMTDIDNVVWPKQVSDLPTREWVYANRVFLEYEAYEQYPDPDAIPEELLEDCQLVFRDDLPSDCDSWRTRNKKANIKIESTI